VFAQKIEVRPDGGIAYVLQTNLLGCGVAVVDWRSGQTIAFLESQEIFDVQVLSGLRFPEVVGFLKDASYVCGSRQRRADPGHGKFVAFGDGGGRHDFGKASAEVLRVNARRRTLPLSL
jgi:hypothetical protein